MHKLLIFLIAMATGVTHGFTVEEIDRLNAKYVPNLSPKIALRAHTSENRAITRHRAFAEDNHLISSEQAGLINLRFSESQSFFDPIVAKMIELELPIWVRHLKARQVYASTYWTSVAHWLHWSAGGPRRTCVFAPDYKKSENLYEMMIRYESNMPPHLKKPYRTKSVNRYSDKNNQSGAYFETLSAGSDDPLRSGTYQSLIWTEVPFTANAAKCALGAKPSIIAQPLSLYVQESTPNGMDPFFYASWMDDTDRVQYWCRKKGATDQYDLLLNKNFWENGIHFPLFTPWYWMKKYVADPVVVGVSDTNLSKLEKAYVKQFDLSLPQLAWRRQQICAIEKTMDYKDDLEAVQWFMQEYPASAEEAFKSSGGPVFKPIDVVTTAREESRVAEKTAVRCSVDWMPKHKPIFSPDGYITNKHKLKATAYKASDGEFLLYALPVSGWWNRYCIGADVAEGLEQGDYSVAYVMDRVGQEERICRKCDEYGQLNGVRCVVCGGVKRIPMNPNPHIVMQFRARCDEHTFGRILAMMGTMYNNAWINPERNNTGKAAILELQKYYSNYLTETAVNTGIEKDVERIGTFTTDANKPVLIADWKSFIMKHPKALRFVQPWLEMQSFTRDKHGRMGAEGKRINPAVKNFDDCVMALVHTYRAHLLAPMPHRGEDQLPQWARRDRVGEIFERETGDLNGTWEKIIA